MQISIINFIKCINKTTDLFQQTLDIKTAPPGVYFVEVRIGEQVFRRRIVKQ
ncbi:T9SS type A sorting domain-containing protein [Spirosoma pulveris]